MSKKNKKRNLPQTCQNEELVDSPMGKYKRLRNSKKRPDAILIKPSDGITYVDLLRQIRQNIKPEEKGTVIKTLRKTRAGDLLIELEKSSEISDLRSDLYTDLKVTLGANATIYVLEPKTSLEVRDLDELTTEDEVISAAKFVLGESANMKVFVSKANSRGHKIAILTMGIKEATKLLKNGHLKIGLMSCRLREKLVAPRCFKCLGFGHKASHCRGPDRSKMCFKCGFPDHKASACTSVESCVLCTEAGLKDDLVRHVSGSNRCGAYKKALEKFRLLSKK